MSKHDHLKLERQARIKMFQSLTGADPLMSNEKILCVEGQSVPFNELINVHAGSKYHRKESEGRWFYMHEPSGRFYTLSAWYDTITGALYDVQTNSIMGADLVSEIDSYSYIISGLNRKQLLKPTIEEKINHAHKVMGNLKGLLARYGYGEDNISYEVEPRSNFGGDITLRFLHTGVIESQSAALIIKSVTSSASHGCFEPNGDNHLMEYRVYVDWVEDAISSCPKLNLTTARPLLQTVLFHLDQELEEAYSRTYECDDWDDDSLAIRFELIGDYFGVVFTDFSGQRWFIDSYIPILTMEDREMANYLMSLNQISYSVNDNIALIYDIVQFVGIEKFGYAFDEKKKKAKNDWLKNPKNQRWLRKDKIQRFLADL